MPRLERLPADDRRMEAASASSVAGSCDRDAVPQNISDKAWLVIGRRSKAIGRQRQAYDIVSGGHMRERRFSQQPSNILPLRFGHAFDKYHDVIVAGAPRVAARARTDQEHTVDAPRQRPLDCAPA